MKAPNCSCIRCGVSFRVPPSQIKAGRKFCTSSCAHLDTHGDKNGNWKGGLVSRKCAECGNGFTAKQKDVKNGVARYCSTPCARKATGLLLSLKAKELRIKKWCVVCGAEILVKPSHTENEGTYCSRACMSIGYRKRLIGQNNPNYKDGESPQIVRRRAPGAHIKHDREKIWIRQNGKCAACACGLVQEETHLDHIIPLSRGGTNYEGNIQLLCQQCNSRKSMKTPIEYRVRDLKSTNEDKEQIALMRWAGYQIKKYPELAMLFHIPNGGYRHPATAARMKLLGVKSGVPDICLPVARGEYHGLWIELKAGRNKPTQLQVAWHMNLSAKGYRVAVCWGWEAARDVIEEYLTGSGDRIFAAATGGK